MSFIDIATSTLLRRHEMELRVDSFLEKCDNVIKNIQKLKNHAQAFPSQLNCEPGELKERYLNCIKQLEEYTYLITDFNIAVNTLDDKDSTENTPVQDTSTPIPHQILQPQKLNLMDILSETAPTTSSHCYNNYVEKKPKRHRNKSEQTLIMFSSTSNSDESLLSRGETSTKPDIKTEGQITEDTGTMVLNEENDETAASIMEWPSLPAQPVLEVDHTYPATIMGVDGSSFWVTTQDLSSFTNLLTDLEEYYKSNKIDMSIEEINHLTYCAFYDEACDTYFRGLIISHPANANDTVEVYRVDSGTAQNVSVDCIQPLFEQFCILPPFARSCHLAGIELPETQEFRTKMESFMNEYIANNCSIEVDDNTSESLGVFVHLETGENLNEMVVAQGIANKLQSPMHRRNKLVIGPPEVAALNIDDDEPEYEDALEAVTGYHNRDEAEICKHYKGGPEKTCFKGSRCKKKHILMHPDGWTLDKVEVIAKFKTIPLPEPGSFIKVLITYVCHFDRLYAHILDSNKQDAASSSAVVPLSTLQSLEKYMNRPTTIQAYKKFELYPAPGEMVAALYPPDGQWYRARVHGHDRLQQTIQVAFIDYGNILDLQEDTIRQLPDMFAELPIQAVKCVLAGVNRKADNTSTWVEAKKTLTNMTLNKVLEARVIARNYEDITVELFDEQGYSVAEQLAAKNLIKLASFSVIDDKTTITKLVVS